MKIFIIICSIFGLFWSGAYTGASVSDRKAIITALELEKRIDRCLEGSKSCTASKYVFTKLRQYDGVEVYYLTVINFANPNKWGH